MYIHLVIRLTTTKIKDQEKILTESQKGGHLISTGVNIRITPDFSQKPCERVK